MGPLMTLALWQCARKPNIFGLLWEPLSRARAPGANPPLSVYIDDDFPLEGDRSADEVDPGEDWSQFPFVTCRVADGRPVQFRNVQYKSLFLEWFDEEKRWYVHRTGMLRPFRPNAMWTHFFLFLKSW